MNSQPKEEQARKGKSMQECRPEEGYVVGHLVIGQAWKCWAVEFLDPREKQSKLLQPMLASMQRPGLVSTVLLVCGPCSGQPVLALGRENPLNDN